MEDGAHSYPCSNFMAVSFKVSASIEKAALLKTALKARQKEVMSLKAVATKPKVLVSVATPKIEKLKEIRIDSMATEAQFGKNMSGVAFKKL